MSLHICKKTLQKITVFPEIDSNQTLWNQIILLYYVIWENLGFKSIEVRAKKLDIKKFCWTKKAKTDFYKKYYYILGQLPQQLRLDWETLCEPTLQKN